ncbi:MAG: CRISPR-associated endonuclease Cas2 [Burkholderiales bacterium]|nr:CRISPR-associated endonuclease Cas2 [Burkholderiales bacterium]
MVQNASREWLIAYDIANKRRLSRLHRFIVKHAVPLQYSLYWYKGSSMQLDRLLHGIEARIDKGHDDVRVYPIPERASVDCVGRTSLPGGTLLLADALAAHRLLAPDPATI